MKVNNQLKDVIIKIRKELNNDPHGIIIGELNSGVSEIPLKDNNLNQYFEFLEESNGARCGAIDLWAFDDLSQKQYRVSDLIGGNNKWFEIGQVIYEPLVIDKNTGIVHLFCQGDIRTQNLGHFDYFMMEFIFGGKYKDIVPDGDTDDWYLFLHKLGYV